MTTNQQHPPIDQTKTKTIIQHKFDPNYPTINSDKKNKQINRQSQQEAPQQVMIQNNEEIQRIKLYPRTYQSSNQTTNYVIPHSTFLSHYERKLQTTFSKQSQTQQSLDQVIKKAFPFSLDSFQVVDITSISRVYKCLLSQSKDEQQILQNLVMVKTELEGVKNNDRNQVTDQTFDRVYYNALSQMISHRQITQESMFLHLTSQFKCKMINSADLSISEINFFQDYLKKLIFFYQHRDNIHSQNLFSSQKEDEEKQRLKLFFFKISNFKRLLVEKLNQISNCLEQSDQLNQQRKQPQIKTDATPTKINLQPVISSIVRQINNQNWQIRQLAVDTIEKILQRNCYAMTVTHMQALKSIINTNNKVGKKFALRLVKRWLMRLLQIEQKKEQKQEPDKTPLQSQQHLSMKYLLCQTLYNNEQQIKRKYPTQRLSEEITNMRYFQPNNQHCTQMQWFIEFYRPALSVLRPSPSSRQSIKPDQLIKLFSKTVLSDVRFAWSQNLQLNRKLSLIRKYYGKNKTEEKTEEGQPIPKQEILCVITEYHRGKTLKEVILNNWKGLQNHSILIKLVTKLFWMVVQLGYFQFDLHIPTLQNVILYDNNQHPEINLNLTSFINSAFLFRQSKEQFKTQLKQKTSTIEKRRSAFDELFPFVWPDQIPKQSKSNSKTNRKFQLEPIKHFLSIILFMICRRLDHFQRFSTMFKKLKEIIDENTKNYMQLKQKLKIIKEQKKQKNGNSKHSQDSKQAITTHQESQNSRISQQEVQLNEKMKELEPLYDEQNKNCLKNILNRIDPNANEDQHPKKFNQYFLNFTPFLPQLYSIFLKKYNLPVNNIKQFEMKNYHNSNSYRISQFENYLGLKNQQLFELFSQTLANHHAVKAKESVTSWRRVFCVLFTKGEEKVIIQSKLLSNLCRIFDYPLEQQDETTWLPPQIYFALKFNIDFCYFQQIYDRKWFNCFESIDRQVNSRYDMETMCLLKNIKSEVTKVANQKVEQMIDIIQRDQKIYIKTEGYINNLIYKKERICLKVRSVIDLFRYLKAYEKRIFHSEVNNANNQDKPNKRKFSYYTNDYFDTFLEEDIDQLEETLTLFNSRIGNSA